jgi:hypothetical protein
MYVCMYVCMHVCMYVCLLMSLSLFMGQLYVCMYACMYVCMYVRMYVCLSFDELVFIYGPVVCMYEWMNVYIYLCMCVCVCVYIYLSIYIYAEQDANLRPHFLDEPIRCVSYTALLLCRTGLLCLWNVKFYVWNKNLLLCYFRGSVDTYVMAVWSFLVVLMLVATVVLPVTICG